MQKREMPSLAQALRRLARIGVSLLIVFNCVAAAFVLGGTAASVSHSEPQGGDSASLQAQLDAVQPGGTLTLEPRVYEHDGVIKLRVPNVTIDGNGATFRATNDQASAVQITADGVQVNNLNLVAPAEGKRWNGLDQHKLVISGDRDSLTDVSVVGSAAAGVFVTGAKDFHLENVHVSGTRADGIHMTGGSTGGILNNVRADQTGDDGIAVVSYGNETPCSNIQITNASVGGTRWGRGITVVGGRDVTVRGFTVADTSSAGIYIATEGSPYFTDSVDNVRISGGAINTANQDPTVVQGAILVYSGNTGKYVHGVQISDVNIAATPASAGRDVGIDVDTGSVSGISLDNINVSGSDVVPFDSNAPAGSFAATGWTQDKNPIEVG